MGCSTDFAGRVERRRISHLLGGTGHPPVPAQKALRLGPTWWLVHRLPVIMTKGYSNGPQGSGNIFAGSVTNNDWTARPWHLEEPLHPTNWTVHEARPALRGARLP